jgi:uncharacterized protein
MPIGRLFWLVFGLVSAGLGLLGTVLPLLPTTPFLLLSAYGFSRSSPRLQAWLTDHPRLGPPIRHWQVHRAIAPRAKAAAVVAMLATLALSTALGLDPTVLAVQALVLAAVALFLLTRPSPPT